MPNLSSSLEMVPTSESGGCSGSFGFGGTITLDTVTADVGNAGGRRDGKKMGRSRVTENCLSGIAHSGLAPSTRSAGAAVVDAVMDGGMVTSTTVEVGSLYVEGTEALTFAPSAGSSREGSEMVADADALAHNGSARTRIRIAYLRTVILHPATVRGRRAGTATCRRRRPIPPEYRADR